MAENGYLSNVDRITVIYFSFRPESTHFYSLYENLKVTWVYHHGPNSKFLLAWLEMTENGYKLEKISISWTAVRNDIIVSLTIMKRNLLHFEKWKGLKSSITIKQMKQAILWRSKFVFCWTQWGIDISIISEPCDLRKTILPIPNGI